MQRTWIGCHLWRRPAAVGTSAGLHVAPGCCFPSAAAAGAPAGVVAAFVEPSGWCAGAVLDVAWCAVCTSAAPSSWHIEVALVVAGVV